MQGIPCCFQCWPGGPVVPPPCRKCGSSENYYTSGLCARCHSHAPGTKSSVWQAAGPLGQTRVLIDSCPDCHGWGVSRTYGWICSGCRAWQERYRVIGVCLTCASTVTLDEEGSCRLCRHQRSLSARRLGRRPRDVSMSEANAHGQQLFFAVARMIHSEGHGSRVYVKKTVADDLSLLKVVPHRQQVLLEVPRDILAGIRRGFVPPPDPVRENAFHEFVRAHAAAHGWKRSKAERVQRAIRILLGFQDTPGGLIRRSDVALLSRIKHSAAVVADVLALAGVLEEDREPTIVTWFTVNVAALPEQIRDELGVWFDVMRHGCTGRPRLRPRHDSTTQGQLSYALPVLRRWATGHVSLREISRDDVLAALPATGAPRTMTLQALRSIFKVLKARKLVFLNPTARLRTPKPEAPAPQALDLSILREALDSSNPATALLSALLAFHAVRQWQLAELRLSDLHDHRLHLSGQVVPLAQPVQERLRTYLDHRARTWPETINPHLFLHPRNAGTTRHVSQYWIRHQLPIAGQFIRQDRILDEAHASGGDLLALCTLFGLSVAGAYRYVPRGSDALQRLEHEFTPAPD